MKYVNESEIACLNNFKQNIVLHLEIDDLNNHVNPLIHFH